MKIRYKSANCMDRLLECLTREKSSFYIFGLNKNDESFKLVQSQIELFLSKHTVSMNVVHDFGELNIDGEALNITPGYLSVNELLGFLHEKFDFTIDYDNKEITGNLEEKEE